MLTNPNLRIAFVSSSSVQPPTNVLQLTHDAGGEEQGHRDAVVEPAHGVVTPDQSEGSTGSRDQLSTNHSSPEHEVVYGDGVTLHHGLDVARNVRHRHGQLSTSSLYRELRSV